MLTYADVLAVRGQRVVLDEGHVMGGSSDTNRALMLASLHAGEVCLLTYADVRHESRADARVAACRC
jgi:hypothetical protein